MRELFFKIVSYQGGDLFNDELVPWLNKNESGFTKFIEQVGKLTADANNISAVPVEVSWDLYALSRVLDCLTQCFQYEAGRAADNNFAAVSQKQYISFAQRLGLTPKKPGVFSPFFYEILSAEPGEPSFNLLDIRYPALMLGNLLIHRGGTVIAMSPSEFNLELVNRAEIYWAYSRANRAAHDLSHGWGSNSQWRTKFRFDFACPDGFLYNSQGKIDLSLTSDFTLQKLQAHGLSLPEAKELTMYRHFITSEKEDNDLFPYDYRFFEKMHF